MPFRLFTTKRLVIGLALTTGLNLFTSLAQSAIDIQSASQATVKECGAFKQLDEILMAQGFTHAQANTLLKSKLIPLKWHMNPQDKFLVVKDAAKLRTEVRFYLEYGDSALIFWKTTGSSELTATGLDRKDIAFKTIIKSAEGPIAGSIDESINKHFHDEWVVTRFEDAFAWDLNLKKKITAQDSFKIIVEEKYDEGQMVKFGQVLQAELTIKGVNYKKVLLTRNGERVFIDPEQRFLDRKFYAPVDFLHISSPFNQHRLHPVRHNIQPHLGIDLALPEGSNVYASRDGVITEISHKHGNGNYVVMDHGDGYFSIFNHLQSFATDLIIGLKVKAGDIIAKVGCTGYCTSPHLHFSIRHGTKMVDPAFITRPYPFRLKDYETCQEYKNVLASLGHARLPASAKP